MAKREPRAARGWTDGTTVLVWLMVAWTLADLILAAAVEQNWPAFLLIALVPAQFATVALWLAVGEGHVLVRGIFVVLAIVLTELIAQLTSPAYLSPPLGGAAAITAGFIMATSLPWFVATAFGWRCRQDYPVP